MTKPGSDMMRELAARYRKCPSCGQEGTLAPVVSPTGRGGGYVRLEVQDRASANVPVWGGAGIVCRAETCSNCNFVALYYDAEATHGR